MARVLGAATNIHGVIITHLYSNEQTDYKPRSLGRLTVLLFEFYRKWCDKLSVVTAIHHVGLVFFPGSALGLGHHFYITLSYDR